MRLIALAGCAIVYVSGCAPSEKLRPSESPAGETTIDVELNWPMTRGGPTLSGRVATAVPLSPVVAWTFECSGPVSAEAAIVDDRVFIGTDAGTFYSLALDSGRELWHLETGDAISSAPAVSGAFVYVTSNDGRLYALDAETGAEVWRFEIEDKISAGAVVIDSRTGEGEWVMVNGYDGITRVFDAVDGRIVWTYQTDDYINGAPALVDDRYVVFGGCDAQLHVVNVADGSAVRTILTDAYIPASIATFGSMAYCSNYANQTVAFDIAGGTIAWVYEDRNLLFGASPGVDEQHVYMGSRDRQLHAIDRETGKGAWKFQTGGRVESSPLVFSNGVVFGSADGRLYAADREDGGEIWRLDLGESLIASPAFGQGRIVVGGQNGTVFAVRASVQTE